MAVDRARVIEVFAAGPSGSRVGSGYLLYSKLILTAGHILTEAGIATGGMVEVCQLGGSAWDPAEVTWLDRDLDAALLRACETEAWPSFSPAVLRWGQLAGDDPVACAAVGFPWAQEQPDGMRDTEHLVGFVQPLAGTKTGRVDVSVVSGPPRERPGAASGWAGMSGAGLLVGPYLVGMMLVDPARYGADRLVAVPVEALLANEGFTRELGGSPRCEPVGAAWRLEYAAGRSLRLTAPYQPLPKEPFNVAQAPVRLLDPEHGVVPFNDRDALVEGLVGWCMTAVAGLQVHTVTGGGGAGKTRLAAEVCAAMTGHGWDAGFADVDEPGGDTRWTLNRPTLLAVDDAELQLPLLADLVKCCSRQNLPIRLLLLSRSRRAWWGQFCAETGQLVAGLDCGDLPLEEHPLDLPARGRQFAAAWDAYTRSLGVADAAAAPPPLRDAAFGDPMMVHLTALLAALGVPMAAAATTTGDVRAAVFRALLDRETRRWKKQTERINALDDAVLRRIVAVATMSSPTNEADGAKLLRAVPDLVGSDEGRRRALARWLHTLRPGNSYWNPPLPDPLVDQLLASVDVLRELVLNLYERASAMADFSSLDRLLTEMNRGASAMAGDLSAALTPLVDKLLTDDKYLLHADLHRLIPTASHASTPAARQRARLLRLTPHAIPATPEERAAMFSVTETIEGFGPAYRYRLPRQPYRARWAVVAPRTESTVLAGLTGWVTALCPIEVTGQPWLAGGGSDGKVRIWDVATGESGHVLEGHTRKVTALCPTEVDSRAVLAGIAGSTVLIWDPATGEPRQALKVDGDALCAIEVDGQPRLATGTHSHDGMVSIWDPATGERRRLLQGDSPFRSSVATLCLIEVDGRALLAGGGRDGKVLIWDTADGELQRVLEEEGQVAALCPIEVDGRPLLAIGGFAGTRLVDPVTGKLQRVLEEGRVAALCPIEVDGRPLLASGSDSDPIVRIWDPATGKPQRVVKADIDVMGWVTALCPIEVDGRPLLASGGFRDRTVRIWDPTATAPRRIPEHYPGVVIAVCQIEVDGRTLLASGGLDGTVRVWDPVTGEPHRRLESRTWRGAFERTADSVSRLCSIEVDGQPLLACGERRGHVWIRNLATGEPPSVRVSYGKQLNALCTAEVGGRWLLAGAGLGGKIQIWDPGTGERRWTLEWPTTGAVDALCPIEVDGQPKLASGGGRLGGDPTVRIWDLATGEPHRVLEDPVDALCPIEVDGQPLLACGGRDGAVRIWDPATGRLQRTLEGHTGRVNALCPIEVDGRPLLASGSDSDRTVRIWDPATGSARYLVPVHHRVTALASTSSGSLGVGLTAGLLMLTILLRGQPTI